MTKVRWTVVTLVLLQAMPADAQLTTRPVHLRPVRAVCAPIPEAQPLHVPPKALCGCREPATSNAPDCARPQDELTRLVDHDTTANLVAYLNVLVGRARIAVTPADAYFRFIWSAVGADGSLVARQVIYQLGEDAPVQGTLPGIVVSAAHTEPSRKYFDVLVGFDSKAITPYAELPGLESYYSSSEQENPILAQVPAFVNQLGILEAIAAGGGVTFSPRGGTAAPAMLPGKPAPTPEKIALMPTAVLKVYGPELPHKRAKIAVRDWIVTPSTELRLTQGAAQLGSNLAQSYVRVSACAVSLARGYASALATVPPACSGVHLFSAGAGVCRNLLEEALDTRYTTVLEDSALCPLDRQPSGADPVARVDAAFRNFVTSLGATVAKGEASLENVPREKVSFGLMTAVRVFDPHYSAVRAKVGDDGDVTEDPLPRLVNAVVVNWHPLGYDPATTVTYKDRGSVRVFVGSTLSPDFGITFGGGYSPLKGLSFNFGYAVLLVNTPRSGVDLDKPVPEIHRGDPFRTSTLRTFMWGLSYSF